MKYIKVQIGYSHYDYMTDIEDIENGDYVVIPTSSDYLVAKVTRVMDKSDHATKWAVQKVDMSLYRRKMRRRRDIEELENKLEQRRKQLEKSILYKILAQTDGEFNEILTKIEKLKSELDRL